MTTTDAGVPPDVQTEANDGVISGTVSGQDFAFTMHPGEMYSVANVQTDALALTWSEKTLFVAKATTLSRAGNIIFDSDHPATVESNGNGTFRLYHSGEGRFAVGSSSQPTSVRVNDGIIENFTYDTQRNMVVIDNLPAGEGQIVIK